MRYIFIYRRASSARSNASQRATSARPSSHLPTTPQPPEPSAEAADQRSAIDGASDSLPVSQSEESDFIGGRKMGNLLRVLGNEHDAGLFFRRFVRKANNRVRHANCIANDTFLCTVCKRYVNGI